VILAGGIVRATGSGMGCPDWPRCFGSWVPPTSEQQLPADYQNQYAQIRVNKNHRLAQYLESFGLEQLANRIREESIAAPEAAFNAVKTWTEYINRLLGAVLGLLIVAMTVYAVRFRKDRPVLFYGSLAALILVVFQGWIGSIVVSTNLLPGMVTFHMALAILLIGLLIYLFFQASASLDQANGELRHANTIKNLLIVSIGLFFIQIAVGTQVRESIDVVALNLGLSRDLWISQLEGTYYFHRTFSLLLILVTGYLLILLRRAESVRIRNLADLLIGLVILEVALGVTMAYFGVPPWAQPLHLLVSIMIIGLQYWLFLQTQRVSKA